MGPGLGRGLRIGALVLVAGAAAVGLAACGRRQDGAAGDGEETDAGGTGSAPPGSPRVTTPPPAPTPLEPDWAPQASAALAQLNGTQAGTRLLAAWRAGGAPITIDDALGTPAQFEYSYTVTDGVQGPPLATRIAVRSEALADAPLGATILAHELTHYAVSTPGPLRDAIVGASGVSEHASRVLDETMAYTVQRELIEQLRPHTDAGYSYEDHSSTPSGHDRKGVPTFARRSLLQTFDAIAADPLYAKRYGFTAAEFAPQRAAIVAALHASTAPLGEFVPPEHITVE